MPNEEKKLVASIENVPEAVEDRDEIERQNVERDAKEKENKEATEKVTQEKIDKEIQRELGKMIKKSKRNGGWGKLTIDIRYRLQLIWIYRVPIFILLVTFGLIVPLLIRLSNLIPTITSEFTNTPTATIGLSLAPQRNSTSTEAFIPAEIFTPNSTPTENSTLTPLPPEITDAKGVSMVFVPAGEFLAGNDQQLVSVYLDPFYIDKYEATNSSYNECVKAGLCKAPPDTKMASVPYYNNPVYNNYPVLWINLDMAKQYCDWRSARIPTGMEWEKAARGINGRIYPWGNLLGEKPLANFCDIGASCYLKPIWKINDGYVLASPVDSF